MGASSRSTGTNVPSQLRGSSGKKPVSARRYSTVLCLLLPVVQQMSPAAVAVGLEMEPCLAAVVHGSCCLLCAVQIDARVGVAADVLQAMLPSEADSFDFAFIGARTACSDVPHRQCYWPQLWRGLRMSTRCG